MHLGVGLARQGWVWTPLEAMLRSIICWISSLSVSGNDELRKSMKKHGKVLQSMKSTKMHKFTQKDQKKSQNVTSQIIVINLGKWQTITQKKSQKHKIYWKISWNFYGLDISYWSVQIIAWYLVPIKKGILKRSWIFPRDGILDWKGFFDAATQTSPSVFLFAEISISGWYTLAFQHFKQANPDRDDVLY